MFKRQSNRKRATQATVPTRKDETPQTTAAHQAETKRVEPRDVPSSSRWMGESRRPSGEQIAIRAYQLWHSRGKPSGTDREDWLEAERQLAARE